MTTSATKNNIRSGQGAPGYADHKTDNLARLRKIEGQLAGISRMVAADRYCIDVLTQIGAATAALHEVALGLVDDHLRHCVADAAAADPALADARFDELRTTLRRAMRL